ncbi:MAG: hypothetical protein IT221_16925 [Fluviicola sp.]|nr:hypothetical protein [Fluviicola sp.]
MSVFIIILLTIGLIVFFIWAYAPDYKRDPKAFMRSIFGTPLILLFSFIGIHSLIKSIHLWMKGENETNKK